MRENAICRASFSRMALWCPLLGKMPLVISHLLPIVNKGMDRGLDPLFLDCVTLDQLSNLNFFVFLMRVVVLLLVLLLL
jgi:hypothetical protein